MVMRPCTCMRAYTARVHAAMAMDIGQWGTCRHGPWDMDMGTWGTGPWGTWDMGDMGHDMDDMDMDMDMDM